MVGIGISRKGQEGFDEAGLVHVIAALLPQFSKAWTFHDPYVRHGDAPLLHFLQSVSPAIVTVPL